MTEEHDHYASVREFMGFAKQEVPDAPLIPSLEVRILRARLILEEAMETVEALGVVLREERHATPIDFSDLEFVSREDYDETTVPFDVDLVKVIDGLCDLRVVSTGTLIACGLRDEYQDLVDAANMRKRGPGHSWDAHGKLIKPPGFVGPEQDITTRLAQAMARDEAPRAAQIREEIERLCDEHVELTGRRPFDKNYPPPQP